jgi:hypothetical protein
VVRGSYERNYGTGNQYQSPMPELALWWWRGVKVVGVRSVSGPVWIGPSGRELAGAYPPTRAGGQHGSRLGKLCRSACRSGEIAR